MRGVSTDGNAKEWYLGHEARVSALDVEELLHANIGTEAGLCHTEPVTSDEFKCDLIGDNRGVSYGDVSEWASVNHHGCPLNSLSTECKKSRKWNVLKIRIREESYTR